MKHSMYVRIGVAIATAALVVSAAAPAFAVSPVSLKLTGSTTLQPLAVKWASVYKSLNPGSKFTILPGGSSVGVSDAESHNADIGMSSAVKKSTDPADLVFTPVARDAVVIVVNPSLWNKNYLYKMTPAMVKNIFLGKVKNWHQVDPHLPSHTIDLKGRTGASGTYSYFKSTFLGGASQVHVATYSSNGAVRSNVHLDKYAIGYLAMSYVNSSVRTLNLLMNSGPEAGHYVVPNKTNALNGKYIYVRDLFFVTIGAPSGQAATFTNWCLSSKGQSYNAANGYLPLH
jgi:phosphate transport system substrate-binding protein